MFMYIIIYFNNVLLPFYIQDSLKFSPANTGFIMSILPVVNVFTAYLGGVLCDKYGAVKMSFRASIIFVIAEVIFALVRPSWPLAILLFGFVIFFPLPMAYFKIILWSWKMRAKTNKVLPVQC